jgi:peptide/nickel transport system permease protein
VSNTCRLGLAIVLLLMALAILGPELVQQDPYHQDLARALEAPSWQQPLGCDPLGRPVLSRLAYGARESLIMAFICVAVSLVLGMFLGLVAGLFGSWPDLLVMRLVDGLMAFPGTLLALLVAGLLGGGRWILIWALCITGWCEYCRMARNLARRVAAEEYVQAGKLLGYSRWFLARRYFAKEILPHLLNLASLGMGRTILNFAAFGFLGIGLRPPAAEWGAMISQALPYLEEAPHLVVFPGLAVFLSVLGFNLLSSSLSVERTQRHAASTESGH